MEIGHIHILAHLYISESSTFLLSNILLITCYCYGVVSYIASHALRTFSDLLCVPIWVLIFYDSIKKALWKITTETPTSEVGWNLERHARQFCLQSVSDIFRNEICRKTSRHGADCLVSSPKEVVVQNFIALKNPSSTTRFEPGY
jgi:hypothetical protein